MTHTIPIVALDVPTAAAAHKIVAQLDDQCDFYKVGLELFAAEGPAVVKWLRGEGKQVFVDLKLHDIPNTVQSAARSVARLGASLLTVHASGGEAMIAAAVQGALEGSINSAHRNAGSSGMSASGCGSLGVTELAALVPGMRLTGGNAHDQQRTMTPRAAGAAGADYLVLGRAVTAASDPAEAMAAVWAELRGG